MNEPDRPEPAGRPSEADGSVQRAGSGAPIDARGGSDGPASDQRIVPLRPLGARDVLVGAVRCLRSEPLLTLGVTAGWLVAGLATMLVNRAVASVLPSPLDQGSISGFVILPLLEGSVSLVVPVLAAAVLGGVLVAALTEAVRGRRSGVRGAWRAVAPRVPGLIGIHLVLALVLLVIFGIGRMASLAATTAAPSAPAAPLLLLFVMPGLLGLGVHLVVRWVVAPAVYVFEPVGVAAAMSRSGGLVRGAWWQTFALSAGIAVFFCTLLVWDPVGAIVVVTFGAPFLTAVVGLLYLDQRIRREHFDLDLSGSPGSHGPAPASPGGPSGFEAPPLLQPGIVPLRPLGVGALLAGAVGHIRSNPGTTLGLGAAAMIVTFGVQVMVQLYVQQLDPAAFATSHDAAGLVFAASVFVGVVDLVLVGLLLVVVGRAVLGQRIGAGTAWRVVAPRLGGLIGLPLLVLLLLAGLAGVAFAGVVAILELDRAVGPPPTLVFVLLLAAVGIVGYPGVLWVLALVAYVLEPVGVTAALSRSARLVRGAWWRTSGVLLLTGLLVAVPVVVVVWLFGGFSASPAPATMALTLALAVIGTFGMPFASGVLGLLYVDRRIRRERFDIDLARWAHAGA